MKVDLFKVNEIVIKDTNGKQVDRFELLRVSKLKMNDGKVILELFKNEKENKNNNQKSKD